jgi:hypothetical protein
MLSVNGGSCLDALDYSSPILEEGGVADGTGCRLLQEYDGGSIMSSSAEGSKEKVGVR